MAAYSTTVTKKPGDAPEDAEKKAHHVRGKYGETVKFKNPHESFGPPLTPLGFMSKMIVAALSGKNAWPDVQNSPKPDVVPPVLQYLRAVVNASTKPPATASLHATWLGHACYFVEFSTGLRILFDPVFEDRCSPFSFMGPKRYTSPPCAVKDLPAVDAVIISHSHYDHLSLPTVHVIREAHPRAHFFVGLGLEKWFRSAGVEHVTEMDWWENADLELNLRDDTTKDTDYSSPLQPTAISACISCLPAQHSSGRTALDKDQTLWCSWAVSSGSKSVWFGGDTGYRRVPELPPAVDDYSEDYASLPRCPHFGQIGRLRGPFDLGLIPIGAYKLRHIFSPMHADPRDAVEIFLDTRCKKAVGIHWGTWVLTSEEIDEPPKRLRAALKAREIPMEGVFDVCKIGETRKF